MNGSRRVVITGMGVVTPIGTGLPKFREGLYEGRSGTGPLTLIETDGYSSRVAAEIKDFNPEGIIDPKLQSTTDRFCHFALLAAHEAILSSGLNLEAEDLDRIGVLIGSGIGGIETIEKQKVILLERGPRRISPFLIPALILNMASGLVSMRYGLRGPNEGLATACATGNHSIGFAFRTIQYGDADVMISGGTEAAITPLGFGGFCAMKALSTRNDEPERASRPFDRGRDGFVMGEGAGILVIEELEHALKRGAEIHGEIVGFGATADAYHLTQPSPGGEGARKAMAAALRDARMNPSDLDYINTHGTSTLVGDVREAEAIQTLLGEHASKVSLNSTKSLVGHLLGAAGGVEAAAVLLAFQQNALHPTINLEDPDPECGNLDFCALRVRERKVNFALSNSLGFGGHNAVLALKRFSG